MSVVGLCIDRAWVCALLIGLFAAPAAVAQVGSVPGCGTLINAYGPFDYTNPAHVMEKLPIVEKWHFDRGVESLRGHSKAGGKNQLGADLDYTLRAFPNHHRALDAVGRYAQISGSSIAPGTRWPVECYFRRAIQFAPRDGMTQMVFGIYETRRGQHEVALERYLEALELMPDSPELHYNLGLLYIDMDRLDDALVHAHRAYQMGFPLPGLHRRLVRRGAWSDPPPVEEDQSTEDLTESEIE